MEKESNSNESDLENEIPDLNSLKRKQTSEILTVADDEEEAAEYQVSQWCKCSAKAVVGRWSSK